MTEPDAIPQGTLLAGKFRVMGCLGVGGMGAVYEVVHEITKHRRALKLLHPHMALTPGAIERFLREASAAGRVGNEHIIETFDAGTLDSGAPYIVMELLQGEPLSNRLARGPLSVEEVVDIVGQACDGMQAAHAVGIVHRDLKPDNLFVANRDGKAFVKILDFGISKFDPSQTGGKVLTQEGTALGTPYYMPPEQIRGEQNIDARSDVYSLAVIVYECLAGERPFEAEALTQLAVLIHTGNPTPLDQRRSGLPPGLSELVHRALAADREQRIRTVAELANGLARFGTISSRPTSLVPGPTSSPAVVSAQSLRSSAVGVSVKAPAPARRSKAPLIVGVAAIGAIGFALAMFGMRSSAAPETDSAESAQVEPAVAARQQPEIQPVAPVAPTPTPDPVPSVRTLTPVTQARAAPSSSAPAARSKPRRTEERGLAQDNPFR